MDDKIQDVKGFIRDLHARAGEERYSTEEISEYLKTSCQGWLVEIINDPQYGIRAVTNRRGTK